MPSSVAACPNLVAQVPRASSVGPVIGSRYVQCVGEGERSDSVLYRSCPVDRSPVLLVMMYMEMFLSVFVKFLRPSCIQQQHPRPRASGSAAMSAALRLDSGAGDLPRDTELNTDD